MFLDNTQANTDYVCVLSKNMEPLNQLRSFMDQFVHYIYGKVCRYQVFNVIALYVWKIIS